jgi:hypothetical protein
MTPSKGRERDPGHAASSAAGDARGSLFQCAFTMPTQDRFLLNVLARLDGTMRSGRGRLVFVVEGSTDRHA